MSRFENALDVEEIDQDRWMLLADLVYDSDLIGRVVVPKGKITDLESIPRAVPFAYAYAKGTAKRAAVVHDDCYDDPSMAKDLADNVFYEAMGVLGVPSVKRWLMWEAVHWFGDKAYRRKQFRARVRRARETE